MSLHFKDIWRFWYELQIKEQLDDKRRFEEEFKPTLVASEGFNGEDDAETLKSAMKGFGTDEKALIDILAKRTADQRAKIQDYYQQIHGEDLLKELKSEIGGAFAKVVIALMKPLPLLLAEAVQDAVKGAGTDEDALIEIFCSRDDETIDTIKSTYEDCYGETVEEVICKDTSGDFEKTLMSILSSATRDAEGQSPLEVAEELAGEELTEDDIRRIMTKYSFPFLRRVGVEYLEKTGEELSLLIEKKTSSFCQKAFKAIYYCAKSRPEFYARAIDRAIKGFGTDDSALIRIIVSRCEIDLGTIKEKYTEIFEGRTMEEDLKSETSGDYRSILLALLGCS